VHCSICQHNEGGAENCETNCVAPQRQRLEAKRAEDGGAWNFDVEAILVIDEAEIPDLVDDQAFETEMEDGQLQFELGTNCVCKTEESYILEP
jgi:hypothetical protein